MTLSEVFRREDIIPAFLELHGLPDNPDTRAQLHVFLGALKVYVDREPKYRGGWRQRGWKGNVADVLRKVERVRSMFWDQDYEPLKGDNADDIIDLMNYCAFFMRNADEGNRTGKREVPGQMPLAWDGC